jgi:hypothetical protein
VAAIRKTEDYKSWQRCGEKRPFTYCWWECKLVKVLWKKCIGFLDRW